VRRNPGDGAGGEGREGLGAPTQWHDGPGGLRPADLWLRAAHPEALASLPAPNALPGATALNGAAFLLAMTQPFRRSSTLITGAHPKVRYLALTGREHAWAAGAPGFDAALALLAALRGLNEDWTLDLPSLADAGTGNCIQYTKDTCFFWPGRKERKHGRQPAGSGTQRLKP